MLCITHHAESQAEKSSPEVYFHFLKVLEQKLQNYIRTFPRGNTNAGV